MAVKRLTLNTYFISDYKAFSYINIKHLIKKVLKCISVKCLDEVLYFKPKSINVLKYKSSKTETKLFQQIKLKSGLINETSVNSLRLYLQRLWGRGMSHCLHLGFCWLNGRVCSFSLSFQPRNPRFQTCGDLK
jgi:hypothetical protein